MEEENIYAKINICTPGCSYFTSNKETLRKLLETDNFLWIKTECARKYWWQFWKDKTKYYEVMCIR